MAHHEPHRKAIAAPHTLPNTSATVCLTYAQIKAMAAYVYTLSHPEAAPKK